LNDLTIRWLRCTLVGDLTARELPPLASLLIIK
jgi:hypothetical protein